MPSSPTGTLSAREGREPASRALLDEGGSSPVTSSFATRSDLVDTPDLVDVPDVASEPGAEGPVRLEGSYLNPAAVTQLVGASTCSICLEALKGRAITVTACGHVFHRSCLNTARSIKCPQCRQAIDDSRAFPVGLPYESFLAEPMLFNEVLLVQEVFEWQQLAGPEWLSSIGFAWPRGHPTFGSPLPGVVWPQAPVARPRAFGPGPARAFAPEALEPEWLLLGPGRLPAPRPPVPRAPVFGRAAPGLGGGPSRMAFLSPPPPLPPPRGPPISELPRPRRARPELL